MKQKKAKDWDGTTVDRYQSKICSLCIRCKNRTNDVPHSCKIYPEYDGVPVELWNAIRFDCEHFDEKEEFKPYSHKSGEGES